jgi:hypothetical protein
MAENPFEHRVPPPPSELIDRERELAFLMRQFSEGGRVRIASPRGYGKTTLIEAALASAREQGMAAVRVDLYGVTSRGEMCAEIERGFEEAGLSASFAAAWGKLARRGGGVQLPAGLGGMHVGPEAGERRLLDVLDLPARLARETGGRVVVCYDEFQAVLGIRGERGRGPAGGLDAVIRSVTQRHGREVAYVFCGSEPSLISTLFTDPERPFYRQADPVALHPLPREALADYITARFEDGGRAVGGALGPLLDLARGHPQRSMLLAHLLWEQVAEHSQADEDAWERTLAQLPTYVPEAEMRARWDALSDVQRKAVEIVAQREGSPLSASVRARYDNERKDAMQRALEALERDAILLRTRGRPFQGVLVDPLFERWVASGRRWR